MVYRRRSAVLAAIDGVMGKDEFLCSGTSNLADLHLIPIPDYFARTEDVRTALSRSPRLSAWWSRIEQHPSGVRTHGSWTHVSVVGLPRRSA